MVVVIQAPAVPTGKEAAAAVAAAASPRAQKRYLEVVRAVERFYQDILEYQWRLDALEAQILAVESARKQLREAIVAAGGGVCLWQDAFDRCLAEIGYQRDMALASLEERASHYGLLVQARAGSDGGERLASSPAERESAVERYRQLVRDTFEDIMNQAVATLDFGKDASGLNSVYRALERRKNFWLDQLEETWGAWDSATTKMHRASAAQTRDAVKPGHHAPVNKAVQLLCGVGRKSHSCLEAAAM